MARDEKLKEVARLSRFRYAWGGRRVQRYGSRRVIY